MGTALAKATLPDAAARLAALTDHNRTLLVEAGAGSGKTSLIAGRVTLLLSSGVHPREIVAITFTEASASELLERIQRFVHTFLGGQIPVELQEALPLGLTQAQNAHLESGASALDEITCTTIHGFCQQLVKPYPVETGIDPGAAIIDPAAAELSYQDLMGAWLSARFGRDRSAEGLGRIPPMQGVGGEEDFFSELFVMAPDATLSLIEDTARFLKSHRTATATAAAANPLVFSEFVDTVGTTSVASLKRIPAYLSRISQESPTYAAGHRRKRSPDDESPNFCSISALRPARKTKSHLGNGGRKASGRMQRRL